MRKAITTRITAEFVVIMVILVGCELAAAWLAYHTLGAIASWLLVIAAALNFLPVALYTVGRRRLALIAALGLFVAVVPNQALLGQRMLVMQEESARIIAYVYESRLQSGAFPADLSGYRYQNPGAREFVHDYRLSEEHGGFYFSYHVGTRNTEHAFTPKYGWTYVPD